jgi:hypothetical protein
MEDPAHLCALFGHLLIRHGWLVGSFEMLAPMVKDKQLSDRLFKSTKNAGARLVLRSLFDACVLDVEMLLHGDKDTNPSILRLARPFLPKHLKQNPRLLNQLASLNYPKDKDLRRQFKRVAPVWVDELAADWVRLRGASKDFDKLRDKWIAHHEVERNPNTKVLQSPELPTFDELFPKLEQTVRIITHSVGHLSRILTAGELLQRKLKRQTREHAISFWGLK